MKKHHLYAAAFPMMLGKELREMAADIKAHGLRTAIVRDEQGRILDGRNREEACRMAGIAPRYVTFVGTEEEKLQFVISQNLHRRQLTASQRSILAVKLKPIYEQQAKARQSAAGGKKKDRKAVPENLPAAKEKGDARDKAGAAMKVSGKLVSMAENVQAKAIPTIVAAVESGDLTVSAAAAVADLPRNEQSKIMTAGGAPAVRAAASGIRRSAKQGKSVVIEQTAPASPVPEQGRPLPSPSAPNKAPTEEPLSTLIERAKASSHTRRIEVIEALLNTLPESSILAIHQRCDELLKQRRNPGTNAKKGND